MATEKVSTPEEWRAVPGYEGYYEVSDRGRVRSVRRWVRNNPNSGFWKEGQVLSPRIGNWGYDSAVLNRKGNRRVRMVHRLVAIAFLPPPDTDPEQLEVNHKNGIKTDNRTENLEWVTRAENMQHAARTGLRKTAGTKLRPNQVREIRQALRDGHTLEVIGLRYGISISHVSRIKLGQRWAHLK